MEGPYCDVIGCSSRAMWMLNSAGETGHEDYLCGPHWEQLRFTHPERAARYARIADAGPAQAFSQEVERETLCTEELSVADMAVVHIPSPPPRRPNGKSG